MDITVKIGAQKMLRKIIKIGYNVAKGLLCVSLCQLQYNGYWLGDYVSNGLPHGIAVEGKWPS